MNRSFFFLACLLLLGCSSQVIPKIKGLSFVASREEVRQEHVDAVLDMHANYVAIMPYGFVRNLQEPQILFDTDRQWFGETSKGVRQYIQMLHANKVNVMLKPQLWIWRGEFTGSMKMATEADWKILETSYTHFILTFAELAEETGAEIFCIGTELEQFVLHRQTYWLDLIAAIRTTYSGKITYAANWDEYQDIPFWKELDYIGIDAYFPLSEEKTPQVATLLRAWEPWKEKIAQLSKKEKRRVLFTEFGYRSMDYAAWKPWTVSRDGSKVNLQAQTNAKKAIFKTFWKEEWFAGGFVWKWFMDHNLAGGIQSDRFTPQNKPAQEVIKDYYSSY